MNTAALSSPLPLYPLHVIRLGKAGAWLVGILCASILFGLLVIGKSNSTSVLDAMVLVACIVQLLAVVFQGQALGRGVSVLQERRAPAALWQAWLRQWLLSVTRYWAVLSIAIALLMLTPGSPRHWLTAPAVLSLLLTICSTAVLARAGLLPRRVGYAVEAILLALLVVLATTHQLAHDLHRFAALPAWILAACALTWPAKACWILHSQAEALRTVAGAPTNVLRGLRDAFLRWAGRYQPLRMMASDRTADQGNHRVLLVVAAVQNLAFFTKLIPVQWGEQATAIRMAQLAVVCGTCANALLVRDLHWRSLLLPGGTRLQRIGTRIVLSTMSFQAPLVVLVALGSMLLNSPIHLGWHSLASITIPLLELACCTSLMTLLRTLPYRLQVGAILALLIPLLYAYVPAWFKLAVPAVAWQIGAEYALLLATVSCAALFIANRRWTPKRLLEALAVIR
ncbi:hypothetical protein GJ700_05720 [Duganella sp. FT92W]|uniref:Uncharacterized protein n=1 Tax=Pseudoduganella rivuli TaxID=2666085 RepID=A0A7X2IJY3_9BURK|nr:hypothetical protein [Pseudoduganella rivuli]MRV71216.1 hypothetical protein [Pseudoduganella rivuli]